jgi:hypothetical protein
LKVVFKICEGQPVIWDTQNALDVTESEYIGMIYKKTAALIAAATKSEPTGWRHTRTGGSPLSKRTFNWYGLPDTG